MDVCALSPGPLRRIQFSKAYTLRRVCSVAYFTTPHHFIFILKNHTRLHHTSSMSSTNVRYYAVPHHILPYYNTTPHHKLLYISYHIIPCHPLSYNTMTYHTTSYHTTVPAKKIAPATKFLPVFDRVVKENSGRY